MKNEPGNTHKSSSSGQKPDSGKKSSSSGGVKSKVSRQSGGEYKENYYGNDSDSDYHHSGAKSIWESSAGDSDSVLRESIDSNKKSKFTNFGVAGTTNHVSTVESIQKFSSHSLLYPEPKVKKNENPFEDDEIDEEIKPEWMTHQTGFGVEIPEEIEEKIGEDDDDIVSDYPDEDFMRESGNIQTPVDQEKGGPAIVLDIEDDDSD